MAVGRKITLGCAAILDEKGPLNAHWCIGDSEHELELAANGDRDIQHRIGSIMIKNIIR